MSDDVQNLLETIEKTAPGYMCRRGPRPSGAMLVLENGKHLIGVVEPTDWADSCLSAGCEIEYDISHQKMGAVQEHGKIAFTDLSPHCIRNIHAEVDALLVAARFGVSTFGATIYSINKPCYNCTKAIIKAGVKRIVYGWAAYDEARTLLILRRAGIECIQVHVEEPEWEAIS